MWKLLEEIFEDIGLPYFRQGSLQSEGDYPSPSFYTFWCVDERFVADYDNMPHMKIYTWAIYSYTNDPSQIYALLEAFVLKAIDKGFIIGERTDADSDRPDYYGRYLMVTYIEENKLCR